MKAILGLTILALVAASAVAASPALTDEHYEFLFTRYVSQYNKNYETKHFFTRFNTFKANLNAVLAHNAMTNSYSQAMNEFGDLSFAEFRAQFLTLQAPKIAPKMEESFEVESESNADSLDWRTLGAVTPVKNQGSCGSCWAFSATGSLEGVNFNKTGKLLSFSEQQLVDCSGSTGNNGCRGGLMTKAFQFIQKNGGICLESDYAYTAKDEKCKTTCQPAAKVTGYKEISNESALMNGVNLTPISVAVEVNDGFRFYSKGVFDATCGTRLNHGITAVGYGADAGKPYWIVKNSWGTSWGEQGYIRLVRNKNQCGVASMACYPTM